METPVEEVTEVVEETPEEAPEETLEEVVEETPEEVQEETPEVMVPETANPGVAKKVTLMALICTGITVFATIFAWSVARITKIVRFEKIYKEAVSKSAKVKEAGVTRAG